MPASVKNLLIGIFVIAALAITVFMLLFLHPSVGDNAKTLRVRFTDIDKVNVGTRVTFAGRPVGEVISIQEIPAARTSRLSRHGDVYVYELILKVDSSVDVFNTDEILLRTSGLLGERNIEINPRPLEPNQELQRVEKEILYAAQPTSVEDTMKQLGELSKKFSMILDDFHQVMEDLQKEQILAKIGKSTQNMLEISEALNQPEKIKQTLDNVFSLSEKAQRSWTTVDHSLQNIDQLAERAQHSWTKLDHNLDGFYANISQTLDSFQTTAKRAALFTEKANQLMDGTLQGKGSLGQILVGDDLYLRLKSILHRGETVMNDIQAYGLLFQNDKRWQRLQARRLRLLQQLSTPHAFANYFNQEVDQISSSLSRVSMLLNESNHYPLSLTNNPDFTKRFSDLLRRVENMEESLKMYNEQVIDQELKER